MSESIFSIINIQEIRESITLKLSSLLNPENIQFLDALNPFWNKVLENPLASIIILVALIVLPYTLIKAKKSSSEASERLDRLMEEMKDFEFEKPVINLQDKFKDTSFDISPSTEDDNEVPALNFSENPVQHDLESASFKKQFTLDEGAIDDFLTEKTMPPHMETEDTPSELPPLTEDFFDLEEISKSVDSRIEEKEFEDLFIEDLQISDEDRELVSVTEDSFDETETSHSLEPNAEKEDYESHDIDDLQTRMEQAIKKLRMNYPSSSEEKKEDNSHTSQDSISSDSHPEGEVNSLKKSHLITHLQSFQKNLENQFDPKAPDSKIN